MQAVLVGPITADLGGGGIGIGASFSCINHRIGRRRNRNHRQNGGAALLVVASSMNNNHYTVLGLRNTASSADIKRAYRLLARKYHPDVSKHAQAGEVFKTIRLAYETLNNEATRSQYDRELKYEEANTRPWRGRNQAFDPESDDMARVYRWAELRRKMRNETIWENYDFYETNEDITPDEEERGSFFEVLRSDFISLFLLKTFGAMLSLTCTSMIAMFDRKLDGGYKLGYLVAWILGGRGGILLSLCLSFASWVFGKKSSNVMGLVVVAMWVGTRIARYAPLPQGALLTLLYMSIKLQADLN